VDDEPTVRKSIKMLLEYDGHRVREADSGDEALAVLAQEKFDLVITDFSMPGMHGDQLITRIRETLPGLPIIMATAYAEEYHTFAQPSGRVAVLLLKPFTLNELREAIQRVLNPPGPDPGTDMRLMDRPVKPNGSNPPQS
jgi:CheY-like chemotaxis protein